MGNFIDIDNKFMPYNSHYGYYINKINMFVKLGLML